MASEKLLPCPCCYGEAKSIRGSATEEVWPHGEFWRVYCTNCQLRQLFYRTKAEATSAWNTRNIALVDAGHARLTDEQFTAMTASMSLEARMGSPLVDAGEVRGWHELCELKDAPAFHDKVRAAPMEERIAVGQDHYNRLFAAVRAVVAVPLPAAPGQPQGDMGDQQLAKMVSAIIEYHDDVCNVTSSPESGEWFIKELAAVGLKIVPADTIPEDEECMECNRTGGICERCWDETEGSKAKLTKPDTIPQPEDERIAEAFAYWWGESGQYYVGGYDQAKQAFIHGTYQALRNKVDQPDTIPVPADVWNEIASAISYAIAITDHGDADMFTRLREKLDRLAAAKSVGVE